MDKSYMDWELQHRVTPVHAPCFECKDRYQGCHSGCEKYNLYREHQEAVYKRREQKCNLNNFISDCIKHFTGKPIKDNTRK